MQKLTIDQFPCAVPVFKVMDDHLAVTAALSGSAPAEVYVDDIDDPTCGLVSLYNRRFFLAGSSQNRSFNTALADHFKQVVYPQGTEEGQEMFVLSYAPEGWEGVLPAIFQGRHPIPTQRHYYEFREVPCDRSDLLPEGFTLRFVDKELLEDSSLEQLDLLREEMCSERASVEDFLTHSFGIILVTGQSLVGWCLSEYNTPYACEVGIATLAPYQRQGLATAMGQAFAQHAQRLGITRIGWHCDANNQPSISTALKIGFEKVCSYPAVMDWFDLAVSMGVHGDICLDRGEYAQAQYWMEQAIQHGADYGWIFWVAGLAAAMNNQQVKALDYLSVAAKKGFATRERLEKSKYLHSLHGVDGWQALLNQ